MGNERSGVVAGPDEPPEFGLVGCAGSADVTPPLGLLPELQGFAGRRLVSVADPLEANALVLTSDGESTALVSVDFLYPGRALREEVERQLSGRGLSIELLLFASHTHQAPAMEVDRPALGEGHGGFIKWVATRISELVLRLIESPGSPLTLAIGQTRSQAGIGRRIDRRVTAQQGRIRWRGCVAGPNPSAPIDRTLTALEFRNSRAKLVAVIWNLACHPVEYPRREQVSADYPGSVRSDIRSNSGDDGLPVLFLQGFAGDVRPNGTARPSPVRNPLLRWLRGPGFAALTESEFVAWCQGISDDVSRARAEAEVAHPAPLDRVSLARHAVALSEFCDPPNPSDTVEFVGLSLGDQAVLVGVSAEPVTEYSLRARALDPRVLVPSGCMDHTFGYAGTAEMFRRGGYEADGFGRFFGLSAITADVEQAVQGGIGRVITGVDPPGQDST